MTPTAHGPSRTWTEVSEHLARHPHAIVQIEKGCIEHPADYGMQRSTGWPVGQQEDWRLELPGCAGLHVHGFDGQWRAHLDSYAPSCGMVRHALQDLPGVSLASSAALGGAAGWLFGSGLLRGTCLGLVSGALALGIAQLTRR